MNEELHELYTEIMVEQGLLELNSNFEESSSNFEWPDVDFDTADLELQKHIVVLKLAPLLYEWAEAKRKELEVNKIMALETQIYDKLINLED